MKPLLLITLIILFSSPHVFSQTNIAFTKVVSTIEQAIQLTWTSNSNETYQIQYADVLTNEATTWNTLYDDYPSQGTNTFWLDCGNYNYFPAIPHPRFESQRFYRILDEGVDSLSNDEPTVSITYPTNEATVTGALTVSVSAYTDQSVISTKLYVDGQEMNPSVDGTNYILNTCEWANGQHVIFATATCTSTPGSDLSDTTTLTGHSVSQFVYVTFSNLVTRINFSQADFDPTLGETQEVTAYIVNNSDWTLNIEDENSNVVQSVSGVGNYVDYLWDGTSNGTNVTPGVYYYYINAETNGEANEVLTNGGGSGEIVSPPSPDLMSRTGGLDTGMLWVVNTNNSTVVPLQIYPPTFDTNGLTLIEGSPSEVESYEAGSDSENISSVHSEGFSPDGVPAPSGQSTPPSPNRPGNAPKVGNTGTFGFMFDDYQGNGSTGYYQPTLPVSYTIGPLITYVQIEGHGTANEPKFDSLPNLTLEVFVWASFMRQHGWQGQFGLYDNSFSIGQLRSSGTGNPLNTVDIAYLGLHGGYGTTTDESTGKDFKQCYFPITSGGGATYLRMSDLQLGGTTPTNGLKWLIFDACYSLYPSCWNSMTSQNVFPYNSNMHMICGAATEDVSCLQVGTCLGQFLTGDPAQGIAQTTIAQAWYNGQQKGLAGGTASHAGWPNPLKLTVACDANAYNDYLQKATNTVLAGGSWILDTPTQVWP
jgi:hypothetical protein